MSFRNLVEPNCGAPNPLMRLGTHITEDAARKDEGMSGFSSINRPKIDENPFVNEFLGDTSMAAPSTFHMHDLMRELVAPQMMGNQHIPDQSSDWAREFSSHRGNFQLPITMKSESDIWGTGAAPQSAQSIINWTDQFFDMNANTRVPEYSIPDAARELIDGTQEEEKKNYSEVYLKKNSYIHLDF